MSEPTTALGIIEGYYGKPWSAEQRHQTIAALAPFGYRFFIYAPKAEIYLRRRWREPYPAPAREQLAALARHCARCGVEFGVGLSPLDAERDFGAATQAVLGDRLALFDELGVGTLAILFDDVCPTVDRLALRQADLVDWIAQHSDAKRLIVCPSYYSDDPLLDVVFGRRPDGYLEDLGESLDPAIDVFWTGEEVCSRAFDAAHLARVGRQLRRAPVLWDNYPVNDGPRMSQYLHLRGFTGRPSANARWIRAHAINPALQPVLGRIAALTLADSYRLGEQYAYRAAFEQAAQQILGPAMGRCVAEDLLVLQDIGLDRLGERAAKLRTRYLQFDHEAAREILAWLDGQYRITDDIVATQ